MKAFANENHPDRSISVTIMRNSSPYTFFSQPYTGQTIEILEGPAGPTKQIVVADKIILPEIYYAAHPGVDTSILEKDILQSFDSPHIMLFLRSSEWVKEPSGIHTLVIAAVGLSFVPQY